MFHSLFQNMNLTKGDIVWLEWKFSICILDDSNPRFCNHFLLDPGLIFFLYQNLSSNITSSK